jgi:eukaryotic-like serine/threonine-protein kinase
MLKPGMFISDRYEIIDKIGTGGMADVYKAKCHRLNRFVAMKVLKQEYSDDKKFVDKFKGEAQSAAGLSHPNIVNVYDVSEEDGLYYIVMELIEGITLKDFIEKKGKLEVKEAIGIAIQIAQGMEAAHRNHIIHRDIKPQNIIISKEGKIKVTDFGIAKAASSNTITSNAMGSVHYISPEQARGGYSDEKSDIYSLGVTIYEMINGEVPFNGDNTVSVALSHIQEEATPLIELNPTIPESINSIVLKCMQKKPERRYLTASALIADLKQSILNPNGDFVKVVPVLVSDSPTISISDEEVNRIKNASKPPIMDDFEDPLADENDFVEDDEDEDSEVDPRLEKLLVVGAVVVVAILALILLFFVGKGLGLFKGGKSAAPSPTPSAIASASPSPTATPEVATVPRVIGLTLEEATAELDKVDLGYRFTKEESDLYEEGLVIRQTPEQGENFEKGDIVELVVSSGETSFTVPDVYGKSKNEADTALVDVGLKVIHEYEFNDTVPADSVISTSPQKGSDVKKGDTVKVILSKGPEIKKVSVPDLSNLTESEAVDRLRSVGLVKGHISYKYSDRIEEGQVISQSQHVNASLDPGESVDFIVSRGPEATQSPEPDYEYRGTVTFKYDFTEENPEVKVELFVNGKSVYNQKHTESDYPENFELEWEEEGTFTVTMKVDEVKYQENTIKFYKVQP